MEDEIKKSGVSFSSKCHQIVYIMKDLYMKVTFLFVIVSPNVLDSGKCCRHVLDHVFLFVAINSMLKVLETPCHQKPGTVCFNTNYDEKIRMVLTNKSSFCLSNKATNTCFSQQKANIKYLNFKPLSNFLHVLPTKKGRSLPASHACAQL